MRVFLIILLILLGRDTVYLLTASSFTLGTFIMVCACLGLTLVVIQWERLKKLTESGPGKLIKNILLAGIALFCLFCGYILSFGHTDADYSETVLIIPGCGVKRDGTPTLRGIARLDAGLEYLRHNPDVYIVVCGGYTRRGCISEAESMKNYLVAKGVQPGRIICEDKSLNTRQNFRRAIILLDSMGINYENCALVTNSFHILRAKTYAGRAGFVNIKAVSVPTAPALFLPSVAREACAVAAMLAFNY